MVKIHANMVLEIMGRPPAHIVESLNMLIDRLAKEQGVKIIERKVHEPIPIKDAKDIHTTFAEISLEIDSIDKYFGIVFSYLPSNMEIISPENFAMPNQELTILTNRIIQRMHEYDSIAKNVIVERDIYKQKLLEIAPHLFKQPEQPEAKAEQKIKEKKKNKKKK